MSTERTTYAGVCSKCGVQYFQNTKPSGCPACHYADADTRGHDKAAICRTNKCGRYDAEADRCMVLVDRGKRGAIAWLYSNPDAKCVADPPMWTDDDDDGSNSDGLESRED